MPDWDADSPQLRRNLTAVLRRIRDDARRRELPTVEAARQWHSATMQNLDPPASRFAGRFRGEAGLEHIEVRVGGHLGVGSRSVAGSLSAFERRLQLVIGRLDDLLPPDAELNGDSVLAIIDLCAWVHAGWVRIHPFANGNGRTARLWANSIAMRYGLPPFIRLRPRPDDGYGNAAEQAMQGDWSATAGVFRQMFRDFTYRPPV